MAAHSDKNREIYDHVDDEIWNRAVYQPVHDGWHFANIGGRKFLDFIGSDGCLGQDSQVLDLCCGSGAPACYVGEQFSCAVTGLDINASQIERAKDRADGLPRLRFLQSDVSDWNPDKHYDLAFALDSLTLIPDLSKLFKTCRIALRAGGRLAVAEVVAGAGLSDEMRAFALAEDGAISLVTADRLCALIEAAGFTNVEAVSLDAEAVRAFTIISKRVQQGADWHGVPPGKIEEWKLLAERYRAAFVSGELGYVRIVATAP